MKIADKIVVERMKEKKYRHLILEDIDDLHCYSKLNAQIKSKQAVGFWFGFKSNKVKSSPLDYFHHESESGNGIAGVMALNMSLSPVPISLSQYCTDADDIINDMHAIMAKHLINGELIRINKDGGYYPISNEELETEYINLIDINEQQMYNYLLNGDIDTELKISSHTIFLENDKHIPEKLVSDYRKLTNANKDEFQIITSFKTKTLLFKDNDWFNFFNMGIAESGLQNIVVETTGQDARQVHGLKTVIEAIMLRYPNRTINIFIKTYSSKRSLFTSTVNNINIILI